MYDEFDTIDEEREYYKAIAFRELFKVLENNFPNLGDLNVLDIAAGNGSLTRLLVPLFKTVTAIDPNLAISENYENLTKEKLYFNCSGCSRNNCYDCSKFHLLLSCCPCEVPEDIIYASKRYNIPFFIILCNCLHGFKTREERYFHLKTKAEPNAILYKDVYSIWYLTDLLPDAKIKK